MKAALISLALSVLIIGTPSLSAQKTIGDCNNIEFNVTAGTCSSGFLEFTVTANNTNSNTSSTSMAAIEITFPGNRTVEKTGSSMSTMTSNDATPIVFTSFTNDINGQSTESCTFRTSGCDPIQVSFSSMDMSCQSTTFTSQSLTFLNTVAVQDPCNCNDPQNIYNADGSVQLFHDVMTFSGTSGDAIVCVTNCSAILDNTGTAQDFGALNLSIPVSGTLTHDFWRVPGAYAQTDFTVGGLTAFLPADSCDGTVCNNNIPTVGEWGLIILGFLSLIFAIVGIKQRKATTV